MSAERFRAPAACPSPLPNYQTCGSTCFKRNGDRFECRVCGAGYAAVRVTPTELRPAICSDCGESFLWRWEKRLEGHQEPKPPRCCRACSHIAQASHYLQQAAAHGEKAKAARASQRRAVARYKPPESLADQEAARKRR